VVFQNSCGQLSDYELLDLMALVNTIIKHITNGNKNQERLVNIMGGTVLETESERLYRVGKEDGIEAGREEGKENMKIQFIFNMQNKGYPIEEIADVSGESVDYVRTILEKQD
jgi:predicted transposase YdaD